jgi:hypothetical protein
MTTEEKGEIVRDTERYRMWLMDKIIDLERNNHSPDSCPTTRLVKRIIVWAAGAGLVAGGSTSWVPKLLAMIGE